MCSIKSKESIEADKKNRQYVFKLFYSLFLLFSLLLGIMVGLYFSYMIDLPQVESLENYQPSVVTEIYSDDKYPIGEFYVERRKLVSPDEIPKYFKEAVISIEDKSFYSHFGIDIRRIIQSAFLNLVHGSVVRGASTITQQLARLMFLNPEISLKRKIKEAILAIQIEKHYTKDQIFAFYANKIYLAHGNYGIASAAEFYFNKKAKDLSLPECALLAAIIRTPYRYSPLLHPDRALKRRNLVLYEMYRDGYITKEQMLRAQKSPIGVIKQHREKNFAPYFMEMVRQYLQDHYSNKQIYSGGLRVYTTLDSTLQKYAEEALKEGLRTYDKRIGWRDALKNVLKEKRISLKSYTDPDWKFQIDKGKIVTGLVMSAGRKKAVIRFGDYLAKISPSAIKWTHERYINKVLKKGDLALFKIKKINEAKKEVDVTLEQYPVVQGSFLVIENKTGAIKALVGGYDWRKSKFNRAIQAKRQTGSIFKPFVYTTALISGMTPDDMILDEPFTVVSATGEEYSPENFHKKYRGEITLREALAKSINVPAVRLALQVGLQNVIKVARRFGITSNLYPYPSLALGSSEISLIEMVSAFSTFPNDGLRIEPYYIQRIEDSRGNVLEEHQPVIHEVIGVHVAHEMISMLRGVVQYGTSVKAKVLNADVAGKTGTTNDFTDAWFIGFTPSITAGAWVGYDEKRSLGDDETGSRDALPIWINFMKNYLKDTPPEKFPPETAVKPLLSHEKPGSTSTCHKIEEEDLH